MTQDFDDETSKQIYDTIHGMMLESFRKFPVVMKLRYFINTLPKDATIDPEKIRTLLSDGATQYDFNAYGVIYNYDDLCTVYLNSHAASCGMGTWRIETCKDCGKEFWMSFGEVSFFQSKELNIPKRCKNCRDKRKLASGK